WTAELILFDLHFARVRRCLDQGDAGAAAGAADLALSLAGADPLRHNDLGCAFGDHGLWDSAERHFSAALELDPDYAPARRNLGKLFMRRGDYAQALAQFERVLDAHPGDDAAARLVAWCALQLGPDSQ
ncbi:MAG: tetratricopeptide repeat protein, partial [Candidatus Hydrogenedentes bacterium]|nr:tetratricopeptide repeat protein [Candidatus Hydrogenedentota bacterium]